jgi:PKD repeat protein
MRSFHRNAWYAAGLSLMAAACGGDGNGPTNTAPTANFAAPTCDLPSLTCTFTDASTDSDGSIASREWSFENGTPPSSAEATEEVVFTSAGPHTVTLTVTDNEGATDDFTQEVTITGSGTEPTASFTFECASLECTFTDASSDVAPGTVASWAWDFGEPSSPDNTSTEQNPTHTYSFTENTEVTVTLTVTDDEGNTGTTTQTFTVAPPAGLTCDGVDCVLTLTSDASVTVTLTSADCEAEGNTFIILTPVLDTLFTDGCNSPTPGTPEATFPLDGGAVFTAGTEISAQVVSGLPDQDNPPTVRVLGDFPTWTLEFDDGRGGPGEPDFNDLVLTVAATP